MSRQHASVEMVTEPSRKVSLLNRFPNLFSGVFFTLSFSIVTGAVP
jgi:hypothetical protein